MHQRFIIVFEKRTFNNIDELYRLADKEDRHVNMLSLVHSGKKDSTLEPRNGHIMYRGTSRGRKVRKMQQQRENMYAVTNVPR